MKMRRHHLGKHVFLTDIDGVTYGWARRTPVGPDEQRWLDATCAHALACSIEVQGRDPGTQMIDVCLVGRAAEQLWAAEQRGAAEQKGAAEHRAGMPRAPRWRTLGVDAYFARLEEDAPPMRDVAFSALLSFVLWLRDAGLLSTEDLLVLQARLDRHVPELLLAMGYTRAQVPAALRPC